MKHKYSNIMQYGDKNNGVVYPGYVEVLVQANGSMICANATASDTSCTVNLPRDVYNISITQYNDIGSSTNSFVLESELNKCIKIVLLVPYSLQQGY